MNDKLLKYGLINPPTQVLIALFRETLPLSILCLVTVTSQGVV